MKKTLIAFLLLVLAIVGAIAVTFWSREDGRKAEVVAWTRSLIWRALDTPVAPVLERVSVTPGAAEEGGGWTLSGDLVRPEEAVPEAFAARVVRTCGDPKREDCWKLEQLEVGGELLRLAMEEGGDAPAGETYGTVLAPRVSPLDELPPELEERALGADPDGDPLQETPGGGPGGIAGEATAAVPAPEESQAEAVAESDQQPTPEPAPQPAPEPDAPQPEVAQADPEMTGAPGLPPLPRRRPES